MKMFAKLIYGDVSSHSEIHEKTRKAAIMQLFKIKSDLKKHKSTIIKEQLALIKQIRNASQNTLELLKSQDKKLNEYILKAHSLKEIDNSKEPSFIESLLKVYPTDLSKIESIESPGIHINKIKPEYIQNLFSLDELSEENILTDINYSNDTYNLKFLEYSTYSLCIFDAETGSINKIKLPDEKSFKPHGATCLIPDGGLFYNVTTSSLIIDSKGSITNLPEFPGRTYSACTIYKDGYIYLFGGSWNTSAKFCIDENRWISITKLPVSIGGNGSAFIFKRFIILASLNAKPIIYYDTVIDSFSDIIFSNLQPGTPKVCFTVNEKLYFVYVADYSNMKYRVRITENFVTWSEEDDPTLFSSLAMIRAISSPIVYNKKYYYLDSGSILTFDLKKKKIEEFMKVTK